jgi:hypothetical protein
MSVERIRPHLIVFIFLFFAGCLNPDRARPDRVAMTRSQDRSIAGRAAAPGEPQQIGQDRVALQSPSIPATSRGQNPDAIRGVSDDGWSPAKSGNVAQASGSNPAQSNQNPTPNVIPAGGPAPANAPSPESPRGNSLPPTASVPNSPAMLNTSAGPAVPLTAPTSAKVRELYNQAAQRFATMDSYVARLRRREQVKSKDQPEELMLFKFRKQPWSVYFKWLGPEGQGREVVYVKGQHGGMIHSLLAAGDMPLAPAGKRMALSPDNIFVRSASRHAITEAGIGVMIEKFGLALESQERRQNKYGLLTYLGPTKRPEYDAPLEAVEHRLPPGLEPLLPRGGRHWVFFDPASHLPVLLITQDDKGHEVEYYCYDRLQYPVHLDDLDFDPDRLWPAKK